MLFEHCFSYSLIFLEQGHSTGLENQTTLDDRFYNNKAFQVRFRYISKRMDFDR